MATFVALNRHPDDEAVHVNMDQIISMSRGDGYTILTPATKDRPEITVKQRPPAIVDLIRQEDQLRH